MQYIQTGEIVSTHGINGELKVYPWADYPEFLEQFSEFYIEKSKNSYNKIKVQSIRVHKNMVLVKLDGIDSIEQARPLIKKQLFVDKNKIVLEEGKYFVQDLIGCLVVNNATNEEYGKIYDVKNLGASDIYYIKNDEDKEFMFAAVSEFIVSTDIINKVIKINVIKGMFDED